MRRKQFFTLLVLLLFSSLSLFASKKTVMTSINSNPSGATFVITGTNYNSFSYTTPQQLNLRPGASYTLTFSMPGYKTVTMTHVAGSGSINVTMQSDQPTLDIQSNIQGADVYIDGQNRGRTPLSLQLNSGSYQVRVTKDGYKPYSVNVNLTGSQSVYANLEPAMYTLDIQSNVQGADVYINGQSRGRTPLSLELNRGSYQIKVTKNGYKPYSVDVNLSSNQSVYANLQPNRYINLYLPKNAKVWINGRQQKISWSGRDNWQTIKINAPNDQKGATVKIQYYRLVVEEYVDFGRQKISLQLLMTGGNGGDDDDDDYDD